MKILVPVKRVVDPEKANQVVISKDGSRVDSQGLGWKPNPFDEYAVEAALRLLENRGTGEMRGEVLVVSRTRLFSRFDGAWRWGHIKVSGSRRKMKCWMRRWWPGRWPRWWKRNPPIL